MCHFKKCCSKYRLNPKSYSCLGPNFQATSSPELIHRLHPMNESNEACIKRAAPVCGAGL